jgi:hypothetical protein
VLRRDVPTSMGKLLMILHISVSKEYGNILVGPEASARVFVGTGYMRRKGWYSGTQVQGYHIERSRRRLTKSVGSQEKRYGLVRSEWTRF